MSLNELMFKVSPRLTILEVNDRATLHKQTKTSFVCWFLNVVFQITFYLFKEV